MKNIAFLICIHIVFSTTAYSSNTSKEEQISKLYNQVKNKFPGVKEIKINTFKKLKDKYVLIDARSKKERDISTLPKALSITDFESNLKKHSKHKIIVYCTIGYRSAQYIKKLKSIGISAYNLEGSLLGWINSGGDLVDKKNKVTYKVHVYGNKWDLVPKKYKVFKNISWF